MNRREAILAGVAGIAAAVAVPPAASAQAATSAQAAASAQAAEAENPELEPIRALLEAYDKAFTDHDLDGVMACMSEKAAVMGTGPGEIWSGPDEIKAAHQRLFERFDKGEQLFEYEFNLGGVNSETGWLLTSGNVTDMKDGEQSTFPVNVSLTAVQENGKWLIVSMHFSILEAEDEQ